MSAKNSKGHSLCVKFGFDNIFKNKRNLWIFTINRIKVSCYCPKKVRTQIRFIFWKTSKINVGLQYWYIVLLKVWNYFCAVNIKLNTMCWGRCWKAFHQLWDWDLSEKQECPNITLQVTTSFTIQEMEKEYKLHSDKNCLLVRLPLHCAAMQTVWIFNYNGILQEILCRDSRRQQWLRKTYAINHRHKC